VTPDAVPLWVTLLGFAGPLMALAGSAVAYVFKVFGDGAERRRQRLFELMQFIDSDKPLAVKLAAVYELRRFPKDREFVVRFCKVVRGQIKGDAAAALVAELDATAAAVERHL
jgi:hypothetical protein